MHYGFFDVVHTDHCRSALLFFQVELNALTENADASLATTEALVGFTGRDAWSDAVARAPFRDLGGPKCRGWVADQSTQRVRHVTQPQTFHSLDEERCGRVCQEPGLCQSRSFIHHDENVVPATRHLDVEDED